MTALVIPSLAHASVDSNDVLDKFLQHLKRVLDQQSVNVELPVVAMMVQVQPVGHPVTMQHYLSVHLLAAFVVLNVAQPLIQEREHLHIAVVKKPLIY